MKKDWYLSKGVWGGILVFIGGGLNALGLPYGTELITFGASLGFIGIRAALK